MTCEILRYFYAVVAAMVLSLLLCASRSHLAPMRQLQISSHPITNLPIVNHPTEAMTGEDGTQPRADPLEYITEEEALSYPPCKDSMRAANVSTSSVSFADRHSGQYILGDKIRINIILRNGYGQLKKTGGDLLRTRIVSVSNLRSAPGRVKDHRNGTYTAILEALWTGTSKITITLTYARETITLLYRNMKKLGHTRVIIAMFEKNNSSVNTTCHPMPAYLKRYPDVFNLTEENSGMPWYCGKPKDSKYTRNDWTKVMTRTPYPELEFTQSENTIMKSEGQIIQRPLTVHVKSSDGKIQTAQPPALPCRRLPAAKLWSRDQVSGYFNNGTWKLKQCRAPPVETLANCLRNKTLLLFGDSTTRQWYAYIKEKFSCEQFTEKWTNEKWHKNSGCINKDTHFKTQWILHNQPFFVGLHWDVTKYYMSSIADYLDEVGPDDNVIALIHMYLHCIVYPPMVFRTKMRKIRRSVEDLLDRNKRVKVLIKGPHSFSHSPDNIRTVDYYAYVYRQILFEEFYGVQDRVYFLDNMDIGIALENEPQHPNDFIVAQMVHQMFAYVC